jgi:glycosyltransferase involved in cell wall biosynthesis
VLKRCLPRFAYELMEFAYAFFAYVRLWRAVREFHPDCLYERYNLYLPSGVWLKQQLNIPMLLEVNAPILDERRQHSGLSLIQLARWCEERTWRGADFVLPVTHVLASRIRQAGVPKSKIRVIANGINRGSLEKVATREEAKRSLGLAGKLVIGFTGFMREWHGLERVLRLVSSTSNDRHVLLVGDGPARPQLEQLILELGLERKVTITGVIGREQVLDYIAAFDIALQPGVVPYASPLKLFEYMALGSAIVAPASANIQEILTHGKNGLLFPPEDNDAFCAAVERLCEDSALRHRLSRQAKATIFEKGLTWDNNARKVVELFASLGVHEPTNAAVSV